MGSATMATVSVLFGLLLTVLCSSDATTTTTQRRTFFIMFAHDIDNATFPETACGGLDCRSFDSFVLQPLNINHTHISKLRSLSASPVVILAYFDTLHIPIKSGCATGHSQGDYPGKDCKDYQQCGDGDYLKALRTVFPPRFGVRRLPANETVCTYPGLASFVLYEDSVKALIPVLVDVVREAGFDGMYLDNRVNPATFASEEPIMKLFRDTSKQYDSNGDGRADTYAEALSQYTAFAPALSLGLRRELGAKAILVGNSAGSLSDPALNGVTIEMEACTDLEACTDAVMGQRAVAVKPDWGVFWLTQSQLMPAAEQCKRVKAMQVSMPWMRAGTDFVDLSHVVCNNTRQTSTDAP